MKEDYPIRNDGLEDHPHMKTGEATGLRDAQRRGLDLYWTGRPCKHGHYAWRYAANGSCRECLRYHDKRHRKGYGVRGRPRARSADYDILPHGLQLAEDARLRFKLSMSKASRLLKRGPNFWAQMISKGAEGRLPDPITGRDIEDLLGLPWGALTPLPHNIRGGDPTIAKHHGWLMETEREES